MSVINATAFLYLIEEPEVDILHYIYMLTHNTMLLYLRDYVCS